MIEAARIKEAAAACGFSLCGIVPAQSIEEHRPHIERWIASGKASQTAGYMSKNLDTRLDTRRLMANARSVIVCAVNCKNEAWDQTGEPGLARIASYALARDYHDTIKAMLRDLLSDLRETYPDLQGRCFTDSAPLLEKELAIRAGLGWRGRNSLLVTKEFGTYILLGELVVDAEADRYDEPFGGNGCGECRACVDNCPNGAICPDRTIDTRLCISRATMYPADDDPPTHGWVFGCDLCQQCCPYSKHAPMHTDHRFDTVVDYRRTTTSFWESMSDEQFREIFGETSIAHFRR